MSTYVLDGQHTGGFLMVGKTTCTWTLSKTVLQTKAKALDFMQQVVLLPGSTPKFSLGFFGSGSGFNFLNQAGFFRARVLSRAGFLVQTLPRIRA